MVWQKFTKFSATIKSAKGSLYLLSLLSFGADINHVLSNVVMLNKKVKVVYISNFIEENVLKSSIHNVKEIENSLQLYYYFYVFYVFNFYQ